MSDICDNCGDMIGKLETPHIYDNHVVCVRCWTRLNASTESTPPPSLRAGRAPLPPTPARQKPTDVAKAGKMIALAGLGIGLLGVGGGNPSTDSAGFLIMLIGIVVWAIGSANNRNI